MTEVATQDRLKPFDPGSNPKIFFRFTPLWQVKKTRSAGFFVIGIPQNVAVDTPPGCLALDTPGKADGFLHTPGVG